MTDENSKARGVGEGADEHIVSQRSLKGSGL